MEFLRVGSKNLTGQIDVIDYFPGCPKHLPRQIIYLPKTFQISIWF